MGLSPGLFLTNMWPKEVGMNCSRIHVIFASVLICVSSSTPAAQSDFDGRLPVWPSQAVDPADLSAPDAVRDFIADYEG